MISLRNRAVSPGAATDTEKLLSMDSFCQMPIYPLRNRAVCKPSLNDDAPAPVSPAVAAAFAVTDAAADAPAPVSPAAATCVKLLSVDSFCQMPIYPLCKPSLNDDAPSPVSPAVLAAFAADIAVAAVFTPEKLLSMDSFCQMMISSGRAGSTRTLTEIVGLPLYTPSAPVPPMSRSFSRSHGLSRLSWKQLVCCVVLFTTYTVDASRSILLPPPPPSNAAAPPVTTDSLSSVYAAIGAISGLVTIGTGIWAIWKYCRSTSSSGDAGDNHNRSTGGPSRDVEQGYSDPNGSAKI